jgi:hypothetical protein
MMIKRLIHAVSFACLVPLAAVAQSAEPEPPMSLPRLAEIIQVLDPNAQTDGSRFQFVIDDIPVLVITDIGADRMRALVPIRSAEGMSPEEVMRVMQANFDTALDARYAVAQGRLWGTYIHPLSPLEKDQFISGIAQTVNIAKTYGSLFSGGAMSFGGGDSGAQLRALIDELLKKGEEI